MVAHRVLDLGKVDLVLAAEAADRVGDVDADLGGVFDLAAGRGEVDSSAPGRFRPSKFQDAPLDRHAAGKGVGGVENERAAAVEDKAAGAAGAARGAAL